MALGHGRVKFEYGNGGRDMSSREAGMGHVGQAAGIFQNPCPPTLSCKRIT